MASFKSKRAFADEYEWRNQTNKETVRQLFIGDAVTKLKNNPFGYSPSLSTEIAEGIMDYSDKLMSNACSEDDGEEPETIELNNMGDTFNSLRTSSCLILKIGADAGNDDDEELLRSLMPMPNSKLRISVKHTPRFDMCLKECSYFMNYTATHVYSATVAFVGDVTPDGLQFGNMCVPLSIIEQHIRKEASNNITELCPRVVDLVYPHDPSSLLVNSIDVHQVAKGAECFILGAADHNQSELLTNTTGNNNDIMSELKSFPEIKLQDIHNGGISLCAM